MSVEKYTVFSIILKSISIVSAQKEMCANHTLFCFAEGYRPLNVYSNAQSSNFQLCLKKCARDKTCKVAAYSEMVKVFSYFLHCILDFLQGEL